MTDLLESPRPVPAPPPRSPRPRGARWWWVIAGLMIVGTLLWGLVQMVVALAHEERVETETFDAAAVTALRVDSASGRVTITATETSEISVRAAISDGLRSTGESREVIDGELVLRTTCPVFGSDFCRTSYDIEVPRDLPITVRTANGRTEITGAAGPIDINGDHGNVVLDRVTGPLVASTDNGVIHGIGLAMATADVDSDNGRVTLEFAAAPTNVEATTDNGSVEVVVPDDGTAYRVDLRTGNGREDQQVRVDPASPRALTLSTSNGNVTVRTG